MDTADEDRRHLENLERHYRPCACRSTTPFFSVRMYEKEAFSHQRDAGLAGRRTEYQRDRDKILYSRSFRRLRLKTQVFPEHTGDYLRTRLDHTLEVAQIARHFARQLDLNEDLVDAIALGHDIGHAPFGHSGERALHMFLRKVNRKRKKRDPEAEDLDGFKHNWQGLRVVDRLERSYPEHPGLNLTRAVRIGILKHTPMEYKEKSGLVFAKWPGSRCSCDMRDELEPGLDPDDSRCDIFEVQVCSLADEIAQLIHEFEDAIVSEPFVLEKIILDENGHPFIGQCLDAIRDRACKARESGARLPAGWTDSRKFDFGNQGQRRILVARLRSEMIFKLTTAVLEVARAALSAWEAEHLKGSDREESIQEFNRHVTAESGFDPLIRLEGTPTAESFEELREWVRDHVVSSERVNRMDGKADYVLRHILDLYLDKPKQAHQRVLDQYMDSREHKNSEAKGKDIRRMRDPEIKRLNLDMSKTFVRAAVDHVAGMTDRFALREYDQLYSAYPRLQL